MANPYHNQVLRLYKTLYFLGIQYPKGAQWFHSRLRQAFLRNKNVEDAQEISNLIKRGEYVVKELESLYSLRKYRAMKARYYDEPAKVSTHT
ncbi:LYR motif-containing protein 5B-like protein [Aphelenchoides besseyi]|nr:LYR motif-containing protein 5B-like protein [Aphelenchoides besseyi]KAI6201351.1 LYR motif-containing protein 5B-like protein [Aphelenchoides besseyi]